MRVQRSRLMPRKADRHEGFPITTAADTVLDLVARCGRPTTWWPCSRGACRSKAVTAAEILTAMGHRKRQRHRQLVKYVWPTSLVASTASLEHMYLHASRTRRTDCRGVVVRSRHDCPRLRRSARTSTTTSSTLSLNSTDGWGTRARAVIATVGATTTRTAEGKATLRYGHAPVREPCEVARRGSDRAARHGLDRSTHAVRPPLHRIAVVQVAHSAAESHTLRGLGRSAGGEAGLEGVPLLLEPGRGDLELVEELRPPARAPSRPRARGWCSSKTFQ